jgi:hypothetical protein
LSISMGQEAWDIPQPHGPSCPKASWAKPGLN